MSGDPAGAPSKDLHGPRRSLPWWGWSAAAVAGAWSVVYFALGLAWLSGAPGNPADPRVDEGHELSLLGTWGPRVGATIIFGLAAAGLLLTVALPVIRPTLGRTTLLRRAPVVAAAALGVVLAVVLPDYRLLAATAYTPILAVLAPFAEAPAVTAVWPWPVVNQAVLSVAGLAWLTGALVHGRRIDGRCAACGRGGQPKWWSTPTAATRWGRWAVGVAVAIPLGYALTRYAWALGIPLGVSAELLDALGDAVYVGAGLATLAVLGAVLTLGLAQRWGDQFPRWVPLLSGRPVPSWLAIVPAGIVSILVGSAGLMFIRLAVTGQFGENLPGENTDVAAWLPEMFWPIWALALAAATYAYWLRRRGRCRYCGRE